MEYYDQYETMTKYPNLVYLNTLDAISTIVIKYSYDVGILELYVVNV